MTMINAAFETPVVASERSDDSKISILTNLFQQALDTLGLDLSDDSLKDSPKRIAKMWVNEIFKGLNQENFPKITTIENKMQLDEMVTIQNIKVMSCCEHHFVPFFGSACIAYIPKKKILGLSKFNRVVDFYSRRPQVQERLTKQIADALKNILGTEDVAVMIKCKHLCVVSRGIQDQNSQTVTTDLGGLFKNDQLTRREFLHYTK